MAANRRRSEDDYLSLLSAQVQNEWSYTTIPP
jgi:hypothetical protein